MEDLKFSVAMCLYEKDNAIWFKTAIDSILNQSRKPDEVIVVVDGPVPESLDKVLESYMSEELIKIIRFSENRGHGNARRAGIEACKNELIAIMDSDDISLPDRFKKQLAVFKENDSIDIVGGNITEFIDSPENIVGRRVVPASDEEIKQYMKTRCPMNLVTVMFKKSSIQKVGGFIDWYCEEDYYLWIRMAIANMKFKNIQDNLVNVRIGKEMYKRRGGWKYFKSEVKIQKYMLKNKIINVFIYCSNVIKRFIVQVLLPNRLRGWIFKKFAREKV